MNHLSFKIFEVVLMIIIALTPFIFERFAHIRIPKGLKAGLIAFCFSALILGDVADFYGKYIWWDLLLHGLSGILLGIAADTILNTVCSKIKTTPTDQPPAGFTAVWIICFVLAIGGLWEMMEYVTDGMLGLNSQQFMESGGTFDDTVPLPGREALKDTMEDMLMNLIGAVVLAVTLLLLRTKKRGHSA